MNNSKKGMGFYFTIVAAILATVGLVNYSSAETPTNSVFIMVIVAIVIEVIMVVISMVKSDFPLLNLTATANAILMAGGFVTSLSSQVDYLGWAVSGLYTFDQVKSYVIFAVLALVAMLINIIASFMNWSKEKPALA